MLVRRQATSQKVSVQGKENIQILNKAVLALPLSIVHDLVDPGQFQVHETKDIDKIGVDTADQDHAHHKIEIADINMTEIDDVDAVTLKTHLKEKDAVDQFISLIQSTDYFS